MTSRLLSRLHRIRYRLLMVNALIVAVPLAGVGFARFYEREMLRALEDDMIHQAQLVREIVLGSEDGATFDEAASVIRRAGRYTLMRIRLVDASGIVRADSHSGERSSSVVSRREISRALDGRYGASTRYWQKDDHVFLYSAIPIERAGETLGVVYVSRSTQPVHSAMHRLRSSLYRFTLGALVVTAILSLFLAATISQPLVRLQRVASRIAAGERRNSSIDRELSRLGSRRDELGEVARAVNAMEHELDNRAQGVADMAANISHEFKSPLTSIRGATELLLDGGEDAATRRRFLENMLDDSERLDRLVTRLLELTRVPADRSPAEEVDYNQLCQRAVRAADTVSPVRLRYTTQARIVGRCGQLDSVLRNLIDNAQQHAAPGTIVTVTVNDSADGSIATTVHNVGRPIHASNRNKIWTRFYTTRAASGGTGLGLPIVAAIVSAHGGRVAVSSSQDDGTTFSFTLPAIPAC